MRKRSVSLCHVDFSAKEFIPKNVSHPQDDSVSTPNGFPYVLRPQTELEVTAPGAPHMRMEKAMVVRSLVSGGGELPSKEGR